MTTTELHDMLQDISDERTFITSVQFFQTHNDQMVVVIYEQRYNNAHLNNLSCMSFKTILKAVAFFDKHDRMPMTHGIPSSQTRPAVRELTA